MRRALMTQVLGWSVSEQEKWNDTVGLRGLHYSQSKNGNQSHLLVRCHLQPIQRRHWRHQHGHISNQIDHPRHRKRRDLVSARSARNGLVPVKGKGPADETSGQDCRDGPSDNDADGDPGDPYDPHDGEDAEIQQQDGDFGAAEAQHPCELQRDDQLEQFGDGLHPVEGHNGRDMVEADAGLEYSCDTD